MAYYDGIFNALGLRAWCDADAGGSNLSMASLLAKTKPGTEPSEGRTGLATNREARKKESHQPNHAQFNETTLRHIVRQQLSFQPVFQTFPSHICPI